MQTRQRKRSIQPLVSLGEVLEGSLSREQLVAQKLLLQADIIAIENQLHKASTRLAKTGKPSDDKWFKSAKFAMRRKTEELTRLSTVIRERRDTARKQERTSLERCFMTAALEELGKEQFQALYQRAKTAAQGK